MLRCATGAWSSSSVRKVVLYKSYVSEALSVAPIFCWSWEVMISRENVRKSMSWASVSLLLTQATTSHTRDAWSVMRETWCMMRIARLHMHVKMWCVMRQSFFAEEATQCVSTVAFLHTAIWLLIYLNINVSTYSFCYAVPNVSHSDVFNIYSSIPVKCHSAGCSSTRLTNFPRYVSSITLRGIIM